MTREELESMESFAFILSERQQELTDKNEDLAYHIKNLDNWIERDVYSLVENVQEEYDELHDKIADLSEAVEEFTKAVRRMKEEALQ